MTEQEGADRAIEWLWTIPGVTAVERVYGENSLTAWVVADKFETARMLLERHGHEVLGAKVRLLRRTE